MQSMRTRVEEDEQQARRMRKIIIQFLPLFWKACSLYRIMDFAGISFTEAGKEYKDVEFVPFVPFISCDTDEADGLCGSCKSRNKGVKQLCRYCLCPTGKADRPFANFLPKTVPMIQELVESMEGVVRL